MNRKAISLLLIVLLLIGLMPTTVGAEEDGTVNHGICGPNVTWFYNDEERVLSISGEGPMYDYYYWDAENQMPVWVDREWESLLGNVKHIVIEEGVTYIGASAFSHMMLVAQSVTLPRSLTGIGESAFEWAIIEEVHVPDMATWLNLEISTGYASPFCMQRGGILYTGGVPATDVLIPYGVTEIKDNCFQSYDALTSVAIPDTVKRIGKQAFAHNVHAYGNSMQLTEVIIPASVENIGDDAFMTKDSLKKIVILNPDCVISPIMYSAERYTYSCPPVYDENGNYIGSPEDIFWPYAESSFPRVTIYGLANSTAEEYAEATHLPFVALRVYEILGGTDIGVHKGQNLNLSINADMGNFDRLLIDGYTVGTANFTIDAEKKQIEIQPEFLQTMSFREHTVTVLFSDGVATTSFDVKDTICGDVDGDGKVNTKDRMDLTRYLAGMTGYTADKIDMTAADVNCDGRVNAQDRMILTRYLAQWTAYPELPHRA